MGLYKPFTFKAAYHHRVLELMRHDKKNREGTFRFTLLADIGRAIIDVPVNAAHAADALDHYRLIVRDVKPDHHTEA